MSYLRGPDRSQVELLPACLDDYVAVNSSARFIDVYVEGLDFVALGFVHAQPKATGRPPYHPADLLKLYLYGYLQRIRSSRRLEAEAIRNLEVKWLLRALTPDFKTIADFRRDNRAAFKPLFKDFNLLCRRLNLFGAELVAIDGSKFKAVNNSRRHYTQEQLRELIQKIESRIDQYLGELDDQDAQTEGLPGAPSREDLEQKITQLKQRRGRYDQLLGEMLQSGQNEVSLTDPDSRQMKGAHGESFIGYNVQTAVDAKHGLIVAEQVVQAANDRGQLGAMAVAAQEALGVEKLQAVADKGYHEADQLEDCEQAGIETFVPEQGKTSGRSKDGQEVFPKDRFTYDPTADAYQCPGGQSLARSSVGDNRGKERLLYYNRAACAHCPLKAQCTTSTHRVIGRRVNEAVVERAALRVAARPDLVAARKKIVEHPFGTLRTWRHDHFLMKGLEKVRAEWSLSSLVYNLRRVLSLVKSDQWLAAVTVSVPALSS
ncbi:MAG TPA: IS1182 family transposase [Candidatus Dormibacteraeota bacterium]|nr:IS1182 family transposase [Candidatus Dormibacteraeota bacterium]